MIKRREYVRQPLSVAMSLTSGKQNEAMLLFAVWDFFQYSKEFSKGMKVIIQTDDQLCQRTCLSFDKLTRAKRRLKKWKYLRTWVQESGKFHHGMTVTHIHIPAEVMILMENLIKGTMQICTSGTEQNRIGRYVQDCPLALYIEEISKSKWKAAPAEEQDFGQQQEQQVAEMKEMFGYE